ncbi:MAG: glycosyltransferase family 9 protein, partial [Stellaceae bacterium]
ATLELMAREELARFAVDRMGFARMGFARMGFARIGIARSHSDDYSRGLSIDRREVAALFADHSDLTEATRLFRPFTRIYSFFASDDARFRRALEAAAAPGAVSFHAFRPASDSHVAAGYLAEIGERATPPPGHPAGHTADRNPGDRNPGDGNPPDGHLADGSLADGSWEGHFEVLADDIAEATQAIARLGLGEARVVLLFPGSGSAHKNWPADSFAALAGALAPPMRALVVLGPAESAIEPVFIERGIACLRDQPLSTVAGLSRLAAGFVGNDSGVSHLAAAAGLPGITIFGPTDPDRWRPLGRVKVLRTMKLADLAPTEVTSALEAILRVR